MIITDVQPQKNCSSRVSVFADGRYLFSLDEVDALVMGIKKGAQLSEDDLERCQFKSQCAKAREKAFEILSGKSATRKMISDALLQKKYDPDAVDAVCNELEENGFIDDRAYADLFLEYAAEKLWGERKIRYELSLKGVDSNTIEDAMEDFTPIDKYALADAIECKYRGLDLRDIRVKQRVQRYFAARGFGWQLINSALNICIDNMKDDFSDE